MTLEGMPQASRWRIAGHVLSTMRNSFLISAQPRSGPLDGKSDAMRSCPKVSRQSSTSGEAGIAGATGSGHFAAGVELPVTSHLDIVDPSSLPPSRTTRTLGPGWNLVQLRRTWPVYSVMDTNGRVRSDAVEPKLSPEVALRMYENMVRLETMDDIFYNAQRQGRMSFYMQSAGEEALQIASAAALEAEDMVFTQYREPGILMWREFGLQGFADQCLGNEGDLSKGRQMPVHYGSRKLNFQIPQASGAGYALKLSGAKNIAACFFGDGAASEGDFHAALAVAATREVPVLFVCRNNGFAISTPVDEQYRGDGVVSRAPGYGIHGIRVDGNDALAMYQATARARELCLSQNKPVLMEAMTYRLGHHSTSDDSSRYRSSSEVKEKKGILPIMRFYSYLETKGWWDAERDRALRDKERLSVLEALEAAEKKAKPPLKALFEDVYKDMPSNLLEQQEHLDSHLRRNQGRYEKVH